MGTKIGLEWLVAPAVIPATAMILTEHPWMAAATLGAGFAAAVLIVRIGARSEGDRERELLTYASTAANLGADPAPVIKALRNGEEDVVEEARGPHLHLPRGRW
jgi:hypothetical protein